MIFRWCVAPFVVASIKCEPKVWNQNVPKLCCSEAAVMEQRYRRRRWGAGREGGVFRTGAAYHPTITPTYLLKPLVWKLTYLRMNILLKYSFTSPDCRIQPQLQKDSKLDTNLLLYPSQFLTELLTAHATGIFLFVRWKKKHWRYKLLSAIRFFCTTNWIPCQAFWRIHK